MSKINISPQEFPDIIMAFLFDKMLHPDEIVPGNPEFDRIMKKFKTKGVMTEFRDYYLDMNKDNRRKYKLIKKGLEGDATTSTVIFIQPEDLEKGVKKKNRSLLRRLMRKLVASTEFNDYEKQLLQEGIENE
jgi:hypothetical protein